MQVVLKSHTPNPEQAIVGAAATCYKSTPRQEILHHIIKAGHWTPLEFAQFNFHIEGISRVLTHQLVRKRVGVAFCQESQRHVSMSRAEYVTPNSISEGDTKKRMLYRQAMCGTCDIYEQLIAMGVPKEDARFVLPGAYITAIDMSVNYHALLDLCKERLCTKAQWEIRELMCKIKDEIEKVSPTLAEYMRPKCYWLKHCPEGTPCSRELLGARI